MAKLIFGCGYLGSRVGARWLARGETVYAITRDAARAALLEAQGYQPIVADITQPETLRDLPVAETVLFAVGFDRTSGKEIEEVYVEGLQNVLAALPVASGHFIYISSTGVYAQEHDVLVDEESPCKPRRPGGKACLAAEQLLAEHPLGSHATILRMAGLYGPRRVPRKQDIAAGNEIPAQGEGLINLIHIDDAADIVLTVEGRRGAARIYLVSDGAPVRREDYYAEIARQLDAPPPSYAPPMDKNAPPGRGASSKRINNQRLREEFDLTLQYPTYREGLAAILADTA